MGIYVLERPLPQFVSLYPDIIVVAAVITAAAAAVFVVATIATYI